MLMSPEVFSLILAIFAGVFSLISPNQHGGKTMKRRHRHNKSLKC